METKKELSQEKKFSIDSKAKEVLTEVFGEEIVIPIDIVEVSKKLDFVLVNARLNENDDGFIIVDNSEDEILGFKTNKLIGINSSRSVPWKRFIIAHELGHYILKYKNSKKTEFAHRDHRKGKDKRENEIDYFSASILMPKDIYIDEFNKLSELDKLDLSQVVLLLSDKFQVTKDMAKRRIEELDLGV